MILKCFGYFFKILLVMVQVSNCFIWYGYPHVLFVMVYGAKKKEYNFTVHYSLVITWEIVWFYYDENKTGG